MAKIPQQRSHGQRGGSGHNANRLAHSRARSSEPRSRRGHHASNGGCMVMALALGGGIVTIIAGVGVGLGEVVYRFIS